MTFAEWVRNGMPHHWKQQNQTDYEKNNLTPLLQKTFIKGCKIDFIGRIENFDNDMRYVIDKMNAISRIKSIEHKFKFRNLKYNHIKKKIIIDKYYNRKIKELVYDILMEDFIQFGYDK